MSITTVTRSCLEPNPWPGCDACAGIAIDSSMGGKLVERAARYRQEAELEELRPLLYPDAPAMIECLVITKQTLKGGELKCEMVGVTNVPNLAVLGPEAWTAAMFEFLLAMHGGDYEHFKASCTNAVGLIKEQLRVKLEVV
jgi:hypothetical protein